MGIFDTSFAVKANRQFIKKTMSTDLLEAEHEQALATAGATSKITRRCMN
jgi:hypothetical protein